jgi:hypothetical protein
VNDIPGVWKIPAKKPERKKAEIFVSNVVCLHAAQKAALFGERTSKQLLQLP